MNILKIGIITLISSVLMVLPSTAREVRIGASASIAGIQATGSETLKDANTVTSTEEHANAVIPSIFVEIASDTGLGFGIDYVVGEAELSGSTKSRNLPAAGGSAVNDSGTNTASAEIDSIISYYLTKSFDSGLYIKAGMTQADIKTKEVLASGSTYADATVDGVHFGIGFERANDAGMFFRSGVEYTDFDDISLTSQVPDVTTATSNKITADIDVLAAKFSVGKKF